jgi:hypothetical protein
LVLTLRFFIAFRPLGDLFLCAKDLLIAAMVDGSALRADVLIADEADRFDAAKAGITVGQEQRQSIYAVLLAGPISPVQEWIAVVGAKTAHIERAAPGRTATLGSRPAVPARPPSAAGSATSGQGWPPMT